MIPSADATLSFCEGRYCCGGISDLNCDLLRRHRNDAAIYRSIRHRLLERNWRGWKLSTTGTHENSDQEYRTSSHVSGTGGPLQAFSWFRVATDTIFRDRSSQTASRCSPWLTTGEAGLLGGSNQRPTNLVRRCVNRTKDVRRISHDSRSTNRPLLIGL
jgi:hypothetical protein